MGVLVSRAVNYDRVTTDSQRIPSRRVSCVHEHLHIRYKGHVLPARLSAYPLSVCLLATSRKITDWILMSTLPEMCLLTRKN